MKRFLAIAGAILFLGTGWLLAQEQTGELIGNVTDDEDSPLPGVTVEATSPALIGSRSTVTDANGRYRLISLPPGTYKLVFQLPGFQTLNREGIDVRLGRTFQVNGRLQQATMEEEITVVGQSPVVDVKKSASTLDITKEMFTRLPKGRDFISAVTLAAGATDENVGGGLSMDGASSSENMFFADGMDITNMYTGASNQNVYFEFIDEVQVKSSGYAAEYGGSMGGVINVLTRAGGNEYSGELLLYYNGSATNGTPRPSLRINPYDRGLAEYLEYGDDPWPAQYQEDNRHNYEFGFGLGGYVIKDRLWFFASYLPTYRKTSRDAHFLTDRTADATYDQERWYHRANIKLTGQPFSKLRITGSFLNDFYNWRGRLPAMDGSSNPEYDWGADGFDFPNITGSLRADFIASDDMFFSAMAGYHRTNTQQLVGPEGPRYYFDYSNIDVPGVDPALVRPRYWYNYPSAARYQTLRDIQNRWMGTVDGTLFVDLAGEHEWKAGFQIVRLGQDVFDAAPFDSWYFNWGEDYESPSLGVVPTTLGYAEVYDPLGTVAEVESWRSALYLQDSWTLTDNFTFNFGVRLERESIPSFSDEPEYSGVDVLNFDFFDKIAPRLGFAWDVFSNSSLKVFGSFGIYYDVMKLEIANGSFGGFKWVAHYYDITTPDWTQFTELDHPSTAFPYLETLNWRLPAFDSRQPIEGDDAIKPYSKIEYTFGAQYRIADNISLTARFLHNRNLNAIEDIGLQTPEGEQYYIGNPGSDWVNRFVGEWWPCPDAQKKFYSVNLLLEKRFADNWMGGVSYTWSYLWGNFGGLASADEFGRQSPNVERYFDNWFLHYDQYGNESTGKLATDRPHQLKVYGGYTFDFGLTLGMNGYVYSGTPLSLEFELNRADGYFPLGRYTNGRTPTLWNVDAYAEYMLKITDRYKVQLSVNIDNLTNNDIAYRTWMLVNQSVVYLDDEFIFNTFDYEQVLNEREAGGQIYRDPRFGMDHTFMAPISVRFGIKFLF